MPDDDDATSRPRERHVTPPRVGNESDRVQVVRSNRGDDHEFLLSPLVSVDGGHLDARLARVLVDARAHASSAKERTDEFDLRGVRSDDAYVTRTKLTRVQDAEEYLHDVLRLDPVRVTQVIVRLHGVLGRGTEGDGNSRNRPRESLGRRSLDGGRAALHQTVVKGQRREMMDDEGR